MLLRSGRFTDMKRLRGRVAIPGREPRVAGWNLDIGSRAVRWIGPRSGPNIPLEQHSDGSRMAVGSAGSCDAAALGNLLIGFSANCLPRVRVIAIGMRAEMQRVNYGELLLHAASLVWLAAKQALLPRLMQPAKNVQFLSTASLNSNFKPPVRGRLQRDIFSGIPIFRNSYASLTHCKREKVAYPFLELLSKKVL